MNDSLGDRMKHQYEDRYRFYLPRRTYTILRVDGRAFHSLTKRIGCKRPYDTHFMHVMDQVALALCAEVQGAQLAYVQSDEVSVLITDFDNTETQMWFDGNIQKIVSVAAGIASVAFNETLNHDEISGQFDARVFTIPDPTEVENYFIWRQKDAERNSLSMLAQHYYQHKELMGKQRDDQHQLIHEAGDNWNNHPTRFKRGGCTKWVVNGVWMIDHEIPIFTQEREYLSSRIPKYDTVASTN